MTMYTSKTTESFLTNNQGNDVVIVLFVNDIVTEKFGQVIKTKHLYLVSIWVMTAVISTNLVRMVKRMLTEESASLI